MKSAMLAAAMLLNPQTPASPEQDIHAVLTAQTEAWNRNDAAAWSRDFIDDASFINVRGDLVHGRIAIEKLHAFLFNGPYHGSQCVLTFQGITFPASGVAVVDAQVEVTNFKGLPPGVAPTAPGILRTRFRFIMVQSESTWKIFAAQNTPIAPQPMPVP